MVEGLDRLKRKMTVSIPRHVRAATRAAMEKSANEIVASARTFAPVDTGDLRDSIGWTWGDAPKGALTLASSRPVGDGERITIYAGGGDAFYARFQEFGTQAMPASPFFFPAYRLNRKRAKGRITRAMKKAIREGAR